MRKVIFSVLLFAGLLGSSQIVLAQITSNTPLVITRPLYIGITGSDVSALQQFLKNLGYFTYPEITGYFGSITNQAVMDFQKANGFEQVGNVGPLTRAKIAEITKENGGISSTTTTTTGIVASSTQNYLLPQPYVPGNGYTPGYGGGGAAVVVITLIDTIAPSISSVSSGIPANSTTTITWNTNEAATSRVEYGLTNSYGSTTIMTTLVTSHSIPLASLVGGVTYHYRVVSTDAANNTATSGDQTFDTPWMITSSIFDFDFANSRYWYNNSTYPDETSALAAIGGSKSGVQRTIGPYIASDAAELITNGTFNTDLSGWTTVLNGGSTASVVSQAARLVSDGSTGTGGGGAGITQSFATILYDSYLAVFSLTSGSGNLRIGSTLYAVDESSGSKSPGTTTVPFSARGTISSNFYVFRSAAGTINFDNISVKHTSPFAGFAQGGITVTAKGRTPIVASGEKMIWSASADPRDEISIFWNASGEIHVRVNYSSSAQSDLNLGTVAPNTSFTVHAGFKENEFYAQLNGGLVQEDTSGLMPGLAIMRIGSSTAGAIWDGDIDRITVENGGGIAQFYAPIYSIRTEGDSYMHGAGGVVLATTLRTLMNRNLRDTSVGGSTMTDIRDRVLLANNSYLLNQTTVFWDGDQNGITTVDEYLNLLAQAITALGTDHFIVIPTGVPYGHTDLTEDIAIRDAMLARWPNNFLDWRNYIANTDGVVNLNRMLNYPTDGTHLNQTAMDEMAAGIKIFIETKGW